MENLKWMNDARLQHIPATKLNFLQKLVFDTNHISDKEKLPFLLALANKAQNTAPRKNCRKSIRF